MTEPIKPTVAEPFEDALQELTGFEVIGIQNHYGTEMERLGGIRSLCGAVWAYENRTVKTSWAQVEAMTLRELSGYFAEQTDDDPDRDLGKGVTPNGSQPSASPRATRQSSTTR